MNKIGYVVVLALGLSACANNPFTQINTQVVDPLITDLAKINATATVDLQIAQKTAMAATPPDNDGFACAGAAIVVSTQINAVFAAAQGTGAGVLTTGELATLFQPGSAQYNNVKQVLTSGCAAKAQDVLGAAGVLAAGGVIGAIATTSAVLPALAVAPK